MAGKQAISGDFDLDSFVGDAEPQVNEEPVSTKNSPVKPQPKPRTKPAKVKKPEAELLSERVQILISQAELDRIKEEAGLVSVSKFLRKYLKDAGLI